MVVRGLGSWVLGGSMEVSEGTLRARRGPKGPQRRPNDPQRAPKWIPDGFRQKAAKKVPRRAPKGTPNDMLKMLKKH